MSHHTTKPAICICENKGADQLCSNCTADQRLCFRYTDCMIHHLLKSKISSFWSSSVTVQADLCRACWKPKLLVFSCEGSIMVFFPGPYKVFEVCQLESAAGNQAGSRVAKQLGPHGRGGCPRTTVTIIHSPVGQEIRCQSTETG